MKRSATPPQPQCLRRQSAGFTRKPPSPTCSSSDGIHVVFIPSGFLAGCFLGNPGLDEGTRHNAGFMVADALARKKNLSITRSRFRALTAVCPFDDTAALLMKPQTYMNLSGEAVSQAARFYKIPPERILVISDEVSLPMGSCVSVRRALPADITV